MKVKIILNIFISFLILGNVYAQDQLTESDVKGAVSEIFDLSKNKDYQTAATKLLFSENNKNRAYNYSNKSEAKAVKRKCKKIKAYLDLSDSYEYSSFANGSFNKLPSTTLNISFKSGDQELRISFVFVKLEGKILLANFK